MNTTTIQQSTYRIEGKFLGFLAFKYIQVQVGDRIIPIKLAKELRESLGRELVEGDRLLVYLEQAVVKHGSKLKLKTDHVERLGVDGESQDLETKFISPPKSKNQKGKEKILLCYKSSCAKRGGKQLHLALVETLNQLGLQDRVSIQLTGCQKQCKQAPSLVLMPGKVKHAYVNPNDLASLLKAHYL